MTARPRTSRRLSKAEAPCGLQSIFCALQPGAFRHAFGETVAGGFADVPTAWLHAASYEDADRRCHALLSAVANREYHGRTFGPEGTQPASATTELMAITAF